MRIFYIFFILLNFNKINSSPLFFKVLYYNSLLPINIDLRKRVITTICCDDCNHLPKIENAGKIIREAEFDYQLMHNGIKILKDCYYGSWMTTLIEQLKGHHEPQEEKCFHEVIKFIPENSTMIELGAYWGYYSMWFQKNINGARNYLIEPDLNNLIIGKRNFELNKMKGSFIHAQIGSEDKQNQKFIDWDGKQHGVNQICIDQFALNNNIDFIHILHSDIQGAEIEMLKGCKKLIENKKIGYFFISTHRGTHEECLKILQNAKIEILLSHTREESFSADGLIIGKLPGIKGPSNLEISRRTNLFCQLIEEFVNENKS